MNLDLSVFDAIVRLLHQRTGLSFAQRDQVEANVGRAMARIGIEDGQHYLERIAADDEALNDLVDDLTVGETYFFREFRQFECLRKEVLPEIRRRRGADHVLRVWSAGCATGEEPYSLAMLFQEEGLSDRVHLLATDISRPALAKARQGVYGPWSLRTEMETGDRGPGTGDREPGTVNRGPWTGDRQDDSPRSTVHGQAALTHLVPEGKSYRVEESIRKRVTFQPLNLVGDVYPALANGTWGMDLILCRNVLIYFDGDVVQRVAGRLFQALAEGGWLITSAADPPLWDLALFEVVTTSAGMFYRRPVAESVAGGEWRVAGDSTCSFSPATRHSPPTTRTTLPEDDVAAAELHVRALADHSPEEAERWCAAALRRHALSWELHYLHAVLLLGLERVPEAIQAVRRVLYLDRSLAMAHFTLASMLQRQGDVHGARRSYRNARDLSARRPAQEIVPLADGEPAGRLAEVAAAELAALGNREQGTGDREQI